MALACPRQLHVFMDDRPVYAANAVHAVPGYLRGYWYFDKIGTRNNSLQRLRKFDPRPMNAGWTQEFHALLVARFVDADLTKFPQSDRDAATV